MYPLIRSQNTLGTGSPRASHCNRTLSPSLTCIEPFGFKIKLGGIFTFKVAMAVMYPATFVALHSNRPSLDFCKFVIRITPPLANISTFRSNELPSRGLHSREEIK